MFSLKKLGSVYDKAQRFLGRKGPGVLTGFGIVLFGTAIWYTYSHSDDIKAEVQKTRQEGGTKLEQVAAGAKKAAPAIVAATAGTVCVVAAQKMSLDMISAITTTATTAMDARDIMEHQLEEAVGKEKAEEIKEKVNTAVSEKVVRSDKKVSITGHGNDLFVEPYYGVKFRANRNFIEKKMNEAVTRLCSYDRVDVYTVFRSMDIPAADIPNICQHEYWTTAENNRTIDYRLTGSEFLDDDTGEPFGQLIFIDKPSQKDSGGSWY